MNSSSEPCGDHAEKVHHAEDVRHVQSDAENVAAHGRGEPASGAPSDGDTADAEAHVTAVVLRATSAIEDNDVSSA